VYEGWLRRFMALMEAHSQRTAFPLYSPRFALQESLHESGHANHPIHTFIDPRMLCPLKQASGKSCALRASCHKDTQYCSSGE
jgi:hypothetical protein